MTKRNVCQVKYEANKWMTGVALQFMFSLCTIIWHHTLLIAPAVRLPANSIKLQQCTRSNLVVNRAVSAAVTGSLAAHRSVTAARKMSREIMVLAASARHVAWEIEELDAWHVCLPLS